MIGKSIIKGLLFAPLIVVPLTNIITFEIVIWFYVTLLIFNIYIVLNTREIKTDHFINGLGILFALKILMLYYSPTVREPLLLLESLILVLTLRRCKFDPVSLFICMSLSYIIFYITYEKTYAMIVDYKLFEYDHAMSQAGAIVSIYLFKNKKYKLAIILTSMYLPIVTRSVVISLMLSFATLYILKSKLKENICTTIPIIILLIILIINGYIGYYHGLEQDIIEFTTTRSLLYNVIMNDIIHNLGITVLFPRGNDYDSSLLYGLNYFISENHILYTKLQDLNYQCSHCTSMEWISNYGLIGFSIIVLGIKKLITKNNCYIFVFYLSFINFKCDAFAPIFLIPVYIVYLMEHRKT